MIEYGRHLFQDAIETNWATAKHALMVLLQDIEKGRCTRRNPDKIPSQPKISKINNHEKVCQDYNTNNCQQSAETNWATAKHAHMVLLQDIEKGRCTRRNPNKSLPSQKFQKSTIMKKCVKTIILTTVSKVQITSKMARSSNMPAHIVFRRLGNFVNIRCKAVSEGVTISRKIRKIPADGHKCGISTPIDYIIQTGIGIRLI